MFSRFSFFYYAKWIFHIDYKFTTIGLNFVFL